MFSESDHSTTAFQASQDKVALQHAVAMLGPDWQLLSPYASSSAAATAHGPSTPAILANPACGVLLLDIAPHISPAAVDWFRATLERIGFTDTCPGNLPVVHRVLPPQHLRRLPDIIDYALSWEPPLTIRPDLSWVSILREQLRTVPSEDARRVAADVRRKAPSELHEGADPPPPALPAALLLVVCGLLIAIGGGTAMMWRRLVPEPAASQLALNAGDDARSTVPATEGGGAWKLPEPPALSQLSEHEPSMDRIDSPSASEMPRLSKTEPAEIPSARLGTEDLDQTGVADSPGHDGAVPMIAGKDVVAPASLSNDTLAAGVATVEPEQAPASGGGVPNVTSAVPEEPVVVAEASPAPDGSAVLEPSPMPGDPSAEVAHAHVLANGSNGPSNEAELAVTPAGTAETPPQIIPDQQQSATSSVTAMVPAESTVGEPGISAGPAGPSSPSRSSDALLSNLLRRGDSMLALGDVSAARLFYERAATAGSGKAATALGKTYDPEMLARLGVPGSAGDATIAVRWYRVAQILGDPEAARLLNKTERLRP
ncbi:hypothetical protein E2C06_19245 [Dankookia rubra]|uniref:Sel1 repeat family protein n=1 Tax=Dankookia rubra TaxID=1442381 RepID=A0A4R5QE98_9PROT|nr:hypothetical protein [Dankookia rubra]TDH60989.1 hypothetical protein E2C06_19245 [Dankookia rubra]